MEIMTSGVYNHKKRLPFSKEWKNKMSLAKIGTHLSEETKKKISNFRMGKHLSKEICKKISIANKGEVSWFKGKKMTEEQKEKIRQSHLKRWDRIGRKKRRPYHGRFKYKIWRLKVFSRDNFTCQGCNLVGRYLEVHHIKSFAKYPKLRYVIENGITLCKKCHKLAFNYKNKS